MISGSWNTGLLVEFFHFGFVFDTGHVFRVESAGNIEISTQLCVTLQPVFVVGFQPVDAAVFENKESNSAVYLFFVFQAVDMIIFTESILQFPGKLFIRLVTDAQYSETIVPKLPAEQPVVCRKVGGNKYKIFLLSSP